jgi:hypothetical protein
LGGATDGGGGGIPRPAVGRRRGDGATAGSEALMKEVVPLLDSGAEEDSPTIFAPRSLVVGAAGVIESP